MSNKQPEALRLADWIEGEACGGTNWALKAEQTAAELRRLHAANAELLDALKSGLEYISDFEDVIDSSDGIPHANMAMRIANSMRAAIAKAEAAQ